MSVQAGGTRDVSRRVPTRPVLLDKDRGALPRWPVRGGPGHPPRRAVQSERGAPSSKTEKFKLGPAEPEPRRGVLCGCPGHTRGTALAVWSCSRASTGPELEGTGSSGLGIEQTQRGSRSATCEPGGHRPRAALVPSPVPRGQGCGLAVCCAPAFVFAFFSLDLSFLTPVISISKICQVL